ncbi:MAG: hypothetical protein DHS20C21_03820 [Gemmatimonadota bacterium]|nr:MAG: hypothetical protein DHS20C21_03820 [Gemmatimonadota bacterium]
MIGKTVAHYRITEKIGAGGMGEVFRAVDTKLGRDVALKMLPAAFAQDAERMARFQREAQVLASLNHPNIGAIYGLEEDHGSRFLVLELIEGPTLFDRLQAGRIPQEEAFGIARQMAEAVEFAHENGVVHRDLKPANVKVMADGRVKVLDFGLAKAMEDPALAAGSGTGDPAQSPTIAPTLQSPITGALTGANVILGTAAYMSPEQARGKPLDRRTDIFSFGCVFYEMLTSRRPFGGETVSDIIARILEREPDWSALPGSTPDRVRRIVQRCLEKDPRKRQRDMGDVRVALEEIEDTRVSSARVAREPEEDRVAARPSRRSVALPWGVAALAGLVAAASFFLPGLRSAAPAPDRVRFHVTPPPGAAMWRIAHQIILSPDGTALLWRGRDPDGNGRLWIRELDSLESRPLGPERLDGSFWSPDGESIGFITDGKLRTMPIRGGDPRVICDAVASRGASWGSEYIVFARGQGPIFKVPINGGTPEAVTTLDESKSETAHRFPHFLPDGETFLFVALPGKHRVLTVYAGHVDGRAPVFVTNSLTSPVYTHPGYLVFQRGRRLVAQAFDPKALTVSGDLLDLGAAPPQDDAAGAPTASASRNGHLAYLTPGDTNRRLVWLDENTGGELETLAVEPETYHGLTLSPDGRHIAMVKFVSPEESDIWVLELERMIVTRFTKGPGNHHSVEWSPDGAWIGYSTDADGPWNIYRKPFPGSGPPEPVVTGPAPFKNLMGWSPDGKWVLYGALGEGTNMDLWIASADGSGEPHPYLAETWQEDEGTISPDGHWVAYQSWEGEQRNVYVDSFPVPGPNHRVSIDGGGNPMWTPDGSGIRFYSDGKMLEASVQTGDAGTTVRTGIPRELFALEPGFHRGKLAPGGRWVGTKPASEVREASATVVLNWFREIEAR